MELRHFRGGSVEFNLDGSTSVENWLCEAVPFLFTYSYNMLFFLVGYLLKCWNIL
ncbi:MAG: hypothetical protein WAN66_21145 [Limnoraphis robusta]|uniref:Uncharacterized protein n=1 Tax=Limnoraphis robusta CCNP1315 TaxID=3110306 RepID=A0ABU5U5J1_9CYAN|nr:hypothetical protein [Limnoraphis robusta]MEA5497980.1 hypothetical protein [Limnoraphis robusta BA-68 BA1]MEA5522186.1 hypothetical protein [Limnoraphis robusta CCNP1315]MEA5549210.1 hypothetical protein [Limnoraphis robusta CCNP1324]